MVLMPVLCVCILSTLCTETHILSYIHCTHTFPSSHPNSWPPGPTGVTSSKLGVTIEGGEASDHWWAGPSYGAGLVSRRTRLMSKISRRHRGDVVSDTPGLVMLEHL